MADAAVRSDQPGGIPEEHLDILRAGYEAFDRGDFDTVLEFLDPDVVWVQAPGVPEAGTFRGREAVRRWFTTWVEIFDGVGIEPLQFIGVNQKVVVDVRIYGRGKNSGLGIDMRFAQTWTIRDGSVVLVEEETRLDKALVAAARAG